MRQSPSTSAGITYHRGSLYLIGRSPDHDEIRHWKVDRIEMQVELARGLAQYRKPGTE